MQRGERLVWVGPALGLPAEAYGEGWDAGPFSLVERPAAPLRQGGVVANPAPLLKQGPKAKPVASAKPVAKLKPAKANTSSPLLIRRNWPFITQPLNPVYETPICEALFQGVDLP